MTNQELKALCERVLEDESQWGDVMQEWRTPAIARETLRLLAQCDAMRGVVIAAREVATQIDMERGLLELGNYEPNEILKRALSQLGECT